MPTIKLHLTKRNVENKTEALEDGGRQRYGDKKLPGFFLRVSEESKVYFIEKKINGKAVKITIGAHGQVTAEQARKQATKLIGQIADGRNPMEEKRLARLEGRITLQKVFEEFLDKRQAGGKPLAEKTIYDFTRIMETVFKLWKPKAITTINSEMVARKHRTVGHKNGKKAYADLSMRFLRLLLNFARGIGYIQDNPVQILNDTKAWFKVQRRQTIIATHDLPAWWQSLQGLENHTARDYITFVLLTGCRKVEGLSLAVSQVDLEARTFTFPDTKNNRPLTLPMPRYLYSVIKKRIDKGLVNAFVFPGGGPGGRYSEPKKQVSKVVDASGVKFTLHDLRRLFVTTAEALDTSGYALKMLVNHFTGNDVTAGYVIPTVERLQRPMQKIEDRILNMVGAGKKAKVVPLHHAG